MSTTREPYVFVSYAHANEPVVRRLIADLKMQGINAWIDESGLEAGTPDWESALRVAISGAKAIILIASPDARASRFVKDELRIAEMYKHRIYPFWVAGTQWMDSIPMGWGGTQYIDARERRYIIAVNELVRALRGAPPPTLQVPVPPSPSGSWIYSQVAGSTQNQGVGSSSLPKKAGTSKGTWTCLTAAIATIVVVVVLVVVVGGQLINFVSSIFRNGGPPLPGSHESGQLHVTPTSFTLIHTQGGFNNGCFYSPGSGWTCSVTLQNVSTTGAFSWSTHISLGTITLSPSVAIIPLSAGQSTKVDIQIPENSCGNAVVTFKGPENSVDVTIDCS
jgi:hypothetical protein